MTCYLALALLRDQLDHERARNTRIEAELRAAQAAVQRAERALDRYYQAEASKRGQGRLA
jgi:Tfp pilus assembly protein PilX